MIEPDKIYTGRSTIRMYNRDCMELLESGKTWDLAIVDPPYGIKMNGGVTYQRPSRPNSYAKPPKHTKKEWDNDRPPIEYWDNLYKASINQIIWGANYFVEQLKPSMGWVYWGKMEDDSNFSDGELAYTSFNRALKSIKLHQFNGTNGGKLRIHPTQKPVKLYKWLLHNYAQQGQTILDTHGGSMSIAIACWDMGYDLDICELDTDYFNEAVKRFENHIKQQTLF